MAIATKAKPKTSTHKKRTAGHHRQTKHYVKSYWPYLPMLAVVALGFVVNSYISRPSAVLGATTNLTQQALLTETNQDRQSNGRANLHASLQLQQAAQAKAQDMVARNYWAHNTPEGSKPWIFMTNAGYQYQAAGENLAYGFDSASAVLNAWMHSPQHRENLLDTTFTEVGFGVAQAGNYQGKGPETIIVALYGQPVTAGSSGSVLSATAPATAVPVSRLEVMSTSAISGFIVGVVGSIAVLLVLVRHGIAWRKIINRGELFVVQHPLLDTALVGVAVVAVILTGTAGFIR